MLYHVRADAPTELRCSWGGPANRAGGNGPADGEWDPVIEEVVLAAGATGGGTIAQPKLWHDEMQKWVEPPPAPGIANGVAEKTTIALRTDGAAIDDVTVCRSPPPYYSYQFHTKCTPNLLAIPLDFR